MNAKWLTVAGVAVVVLLLARGLMAREPDPYDPKAWDYLPGYKPGSGYML